MGRNVIKLSDCDIVGTNRVHLSNPILFGFMHSLVIGEAGVTLDYMEKFLAKMNPVYEGIYLVDRSIFNTR